MKKARAQSQAGRVITWDKLEIVGEGWRYVVTDSQDEYQMKWPSYIDSVTDYLQRLGEIWVKGV